LDSTSNANFEKLNNLDILEDVARHLGFRLSLAHLATATLAENKSADGLQALRWWQEGKILEIIEYCRQDVKITRDLYRFGKDNGHLVYTDKEHHNVRIPVAWQ
jgi:DEAD/DEAH box helicase domain-containing protein